MIDEPPTKPPKDNAAAIRLFTLVLVPFLWCWGFCVSHFGMGCDTPLALSKATAYTLSSMGGYLAYFLIWKPSSLLYTPHLLPIVNNSLLNQTVTPWPFHEMLAFGLISSISFALLIGPLFRLFERRRGLKPTPPSSLHPLSDDQIS
jgi:hypothetical protein